MINIFVYKLKLFLTVFCVIKLTAFSACNPKNNLVTDSKNGLIDNGISFNVPNTSYCKLIDNAEQYNDEIVRVKMAITFGLEGSWLSDERCKGGIDNAAKIIFTKETSQDIDFEKNRNSQNKSDELLITGRFKNISYNYGGLKTPFQFEVIRIDKVLKDNQQ